MLVWDMNYYQHMNAKQDNVGILCFKQEEINKQVVMYL